MRVLSFGEQALKDKQSIQTLLQVVNEAVAGDITAGKAPGLSASGERGSSGPTDKKTAALVLIVSSLQGVREALVEAAGQAEEGSGSYLDRIDLIRERVLEIIRGLFSPREQSGVITAVQILLNDLEDILHGVQLIRECSPRTHDLVLSFGTQISSILTSRCLEKEGFAVRTEDNPGIVLRMNQHGMLQVDFQRSYESIGSTLGKDEAISIVAGGIARSEDGAITILQSDGSDLSASLIGAALNAEIVEMWTGMDGVMSADPGYVPEAFVIPALSYQEAMELSFFGARMIHSQSLVPAMEAGIPIRIRNLERPELSGTRICVDPQRKQTSIVGIASIEPVALVNIEGGGMVGVPGIAARIFGNIGSSCSEHHHDFSGLLGAQYLRGLSPGGGRRGTRGPAGRAGAGASGQTDPELRFTKRPGHSGGDRREHAGDPGNFRQTIQCARGGRNQHSGDCPGLFRNKHFFYHRESGRTGSPQDDSPGLSWLDLCLSVQ